MQSPTSPPNRPRVESNRNLGTELALSLLTCLALVGGVLAAASTVQILPGPSVVVVPAALVVALATVVVASRCAIAVGRTALGVIERLARRVSSESEPLEPRSNRERTERPDRGRLERWASARLDGSDR